MGRGEEPKELRQAWPQLRGCRAGVCRALRHVPDLPHEDNRFVYGEERLITLGLLAGRLVVIAHAPRDVGTRIISMRKGNRREQKIRRY
jgi:uncharacterized DUF497 family protein